MDRNIGLSAGIIALLALAARVAIPTGGGQIADRTESGAKAKKAKVAPASSPPEANYEGPWLVTRRFFIPQEPTPPVRDTASHLLNLASPGDLLDCASAD